MKMRVHFRHLGIYSLVFLIVVAAPAGEIDPPPGPIQSTMRTLLEVEPRTAINAENTPGSPGNPGLPSTFRISQPGSYYLTGDIVGESGAIGIEVAASGVSIDLMGYTLQGVLGADIGIVMDSEYDNLSIANGTIRDWRIGFFAGNSVNIRLRDIRALGNDQNGLWSGRNSVITGCLALENGGSGILASTSSVIADCVARDNGGDGISALDASVITRCVVEGNQDDGVRAGRSNTVTNCASRDNSGNGISTTNLDVLVLRNVASFNGENGIDATGRCFVRENVCRANGQVDSSSGAGIRVSGRHARIERNHLVNNVRGMRAVLADTFIARNSASGNSLANWHIDTGNPCLVLFANTSGSAINGDAGGIFPGTSSAWVNWTH